MGQVQGGVFIQAVKPPIGVLRFVRLDETDAGLADDNPVAGQNIPAVSIKLIGKQRNSGTDRVGRIHDDDVKKAVVTLEEGHSIDVSTGL